MTVEHGQEAFAVRRIAVLDDQIKDQAAPAGCEVELVTILDPPAAFDDNIGMRLEQADDLLARRNRCALKHTALGLGDDLRDQRTMAGERRLQLQRHRALG